MARLVGGVVGAVIGYYAGNPGLGWAIGSAIGGAFEPNAKVTGPKLQDLSVPGTEYGQPIPYIFGHMRTAGQVWWSSNKREVETTTTQGKGPGTDTTTFNYEIDLLIGLCDNEAAGVTRIWNNGALVYSTLPGSDDASLIASQTSELWHRLTFYSGADDQLPDPTYEAAVGVGNAPAYRGRATLFIEALQLGNSGQMLNLNFEVTRTNSSAESRTSLISTYTFSLPWDSSNFFSPQFATLARVGSNLITHINTHGAGNWAVDPNFSTNTPGVPNPDLPPWVDGNIVSFPLNGGAGKLLGTFRAQAPLIEAPDDPFVQTTWLPSAINQSDVPASMTSVKTTTQISVSPGYEFSAIDILRYGDGTTVDPVTGLPDPSGVTVLGFQQAVAGLNANTIGQAAYRDAEFIHQLQPVPPPNGAVTADDYKVLSTLGSKSEVLPFIDHLVITPNRVWGLIIDSAESLRLVELDRSGLTTIGIYAASPDIILHADAFLSNDSDSPYLLYTEQVSSHQVLAHWNQIDQGWTLVSVIPPMGPVFFQHDGTTPIGGGGTAPFAAFNCTLIEESLFGIHAKFVRDDAAQLQPTGEIQIWAAQSIVDVNDDTLRHGVEALCLRAGLTADQFDASALSYVTKPLRGFGVSQIGGTRASLDILAAAYFFEMALWDKIYFVPRGSGPVVRIPFADLGTSSDDGTTLVDQFIPKRESDLEVPMRVAVSYMNIDFDYQTDAQNSERYFTGDDGTISPVSMPLVFTAEEAKGIAITMILDQTVAALGSGQIYLQSKYARLIPTDVVEVVDEDGSIYRIRLVKRTDAGSVLTFDYVFDDESVLTDTGITTAVYSPTTVVAGPSSTDLELMDIAPLRDADAGPGLYAAANSSSAKWPGAAVMESTDGVNFAQVATIPTKSVIGVATNILGSWDGGSVIDQMNILNVTVGQGQVLSSTTRAVLFVNPTINSLLVGSEIVRFLTATLVSAGSYKISGLMRGRRGTEWATDSHVSNERVVLLDPNALRRVTDQVSDLGVPKYFKGVTMGRNVSTADTLPFTDTGESTKPFSPVDLRVTPSGNGDCTLTWKRRTRLSCNFTGPAGIIVPLDQDIEIYDIEFLTSLSSGAVVVRTERVNAPTFLYTGGQQKVDFGVRQSVLRVNIYQVSPTAGRGRPLHQAVDTGFVPGRFTHTITLGGTFEPGIPIQILVGNDVLVAHTTSISNDGDLSGLAATLSVLIDDTADYEAAVFGTEIDVTGPVDQDFVLRAAVAGGSDINVVKTQNAAVVGPGTAYHARIFPGINLSGATTYPAGVTFTVNVERPAGTPVGSFSYTTTTVSTEYQVIDFLSVALAANAGLVGAGFEMNIGTDSFGSYYGDFFGPIGLSQVSLGPSTSNPSYSLYASIQPGGLGSDPVITPTDEKIEVRILGTPVVGDQFNVTLLFTTYSYTVAPGNTVNDVAAGIAAVIDALTDYSATSSGSVATITANTGVDSVYQYGSVTRAITVTIS